MRYNNERYSAMDEFANRRPAYDEPRKSGCLGNVLKIGFGFVAGVICTLMAGYYMRSQLAETVQPVQKEQPVAEKVVKTAPVKSTHYPISLARKLIHKGMSKDSVIGLFGEPTRFSNTKYHDEIEYRYGPHGTNRLEIKFEKEKVVSISQY